MPTPPHARAPHRALGFMLALLLLSCGSNEDSAPPGEVKDAASLSAALSTASSGDTLQLTGATYEGHFNIPSGVTVVGRGETLLRGTRDAAVVRLAGGSRETPTRLSGVRVENDGLAVLASGGGHVAVDGVTMEVTALGGFFAEGLDGLSLAQVTTTGSVNGETIAQLGFEIEASEFPISGVLINDVEDVQINSLAISNFAGFGAILRQSQTTWAGGAVADWVGTGILVEGGSAHLSELQVAGSLSGDTLVIVPNGIAVTQGGVLETEGVLVDRIGGIGLLQDGARSEHTNLMVLSAFKAGVWVQNAPGAAGAPALTFVAGGMSVIDNSLGLGIYMRDFGGLAVDGLVVGDTSTRSELLGLGTPEEIGDGLHMVGPSGAITLANATFTGNARVGLLADGRDPALDDPRPLTVSLDDVLIDIGDLDANGVRGRAVQEVTDFSQALEEVFIVEETGLSIDPELSERDEQDRSVLNVVPKLERVVNFSNALPSGTLIGDEGMVDQSGQLRGRPTIDEFGIVEETGL